MSEPVDPRRQLPSVERLAGDTRLADLEIRPDLLRNAIRLRLADERESIATKGETGHETAERIIADLQRTFGPPFPPVINATGILIHTNLGRVPVSRATAEAMSVAAASSVALEIDPATGRRGNRQERVSALLRALTSCEAALVVNNNAAAVLLTVATLAGGREAIVSRGEAVEIGGGFRIPDVLRQGGATLVEVGTTNRTYASDYRDAITAKTGILLKVHPSNFVITGYTHAASVRELAGIGRGGQLPVVEDEGSGLLNPIALPGLDLGRSLSECLADGADVVTASGDKLLGGPQCGLILGRTDLVARIARHPLARAVRVDKVTLAGLEITLHHYLRGQEATDIPLWRMAGASVSGLERRASAILQPFTGESDAYGLQVSTPLSGTGEPTTAASGGSDPGAGEGMGERSARHKPASQNTARVQPDSVSERMSVVPSEATFGGGALPGQTLPSVAIRLRASSTDSAESLGRRLRLGNPGVWGRIQDDAVLLDLRSVAPEDDDRVAEAIRMAGAGF